MSDAAAPGDGRRAIQHVLDRLAGPGAIPRDDQVAAVDAVLQPRSRVLVVQATGWGKSAVYWAATRALRDRGAGPTLVISPLLALMRDQVQAAGRAGLVAATINSSNQEEWDPILQAIQNDGLDVLLISPERLGNEAFARELPGLLERVGLIVIDEAHCISDWGFDFRPDYHRLARALLATPHAAVLATTATANERVTQDVATQLGPASITFRGPLARTSLRLSVIPGLDPTQRYAWVDEALATLPGSGIVYALTVAEAERLHRYLESRGHQVAVYTGGMDADVRLAVEHRLRQNQVKAVIATSALGMGYDKPDLGFCVHLGSPASPVAYYQQVGRAGRALDHAEAVLLPAERDEAIWEYFATASIPDPDDAARVLAILAEGPRGRGDLEAATGIRTGRLEALLKILAVEGVVVREQSRWAATGTPYRHDAQRWEDLKAVRRSEAGIMRDYARGRGCLMAFLQQALDDPSAGPCGRCSVCTGNLPAPGTTPSRDAVVAAQSFLRGQDVIIETRQRWPSGTSRKGTIRSVSLARAVAFADDPGWPTELADLAIAPPGVIPPVLLDGAVATLGRWAPDWPQRPAVVMPLAAPGMASNRALAAAIGEAGRLPVLDLLSWDGPPVPGDPASAALVRHLEAVVRFSGWQEPPSGPVLLVATQVRTRWTATLAGALLREAGAPDVYLLALHQQP